MHVRGYWLIMLLVLGVAATATAGPSERESKRREALRARAERMLPLGEIETFWVSPQQVCVHEPTQPPRLVDRESGETTFVVDEARLQASLTRVLELAGQAQVAYEVVGGDEQALWLVARDCLLRLGIADQEVRLLDAASVTRLHLATGERRSPPERHGAARVFFVNRTVNPVDVFWLNRSGVRKKYATLTAGSSYVQSTWAGHVWFICEPDGDEIVRFEARRGFHVGYITEQPERSKSPTPTPQGAEASAWRAYVRYKRIQLVSKTSTATVDVLEIGGESDDWLNGSRTIWSPDGRYFAVLRERRGLEPLSLRVMDSTRGTPARGELREWSYAKPGDARMQKFPIVIDTRIQRRLPFVTDWSESWSLGRMRFSKNSRYLFFLRNARGHQAHELHMWDMQAGKSRLLIDERSETFIDYSQKTYLRAVDEDKAWIWMSERSGWNHLYRIETESGKATPITQGAWLVRSVEHVDEARREITFKAMGVHPGQDPYHIHFGRVSFDGGEPVWLTDGDGTNEIAYSEDRRHYIATWSRVDKAPVHELRRTSDGKRIATLSTTPTLKGEQGKWLLPERHVMRREGQPDVWGIIHRPTDFDPGRRYPIVESVYAGPQGQHVPKAYRRVFEPRLLADLGFIVIQSDAPGTNWRHKEWHDACWKNVADAGLEERVQWIKDAASTRPWMDTTRVGICGGSAGGQTALRAMLRFPDFYRVGVADCGCHDNRVDKMWWNEAWMGWPVDESYAEQSNVTLAHKLEGKLLLIVGEVDRNVDPVSTMRVVHALIKADKDFDLLVMPGVGHGAMATPYGRRRQADFLRRHLGAGGGE